MYTPINGFVDDYRELKGYLLQNGQISLENNIENHLKKVMLLSCASYYESQIQEIIKSFVQKKSTDDKISNFVVNKAISRQYHTYFNWDGNNINSFLGLFGEEFKKEVSTIISQDEQLKEQMKAFLQLGNERNKMVHENFLVYNLEKTFDEIIQLNDKAEKFVNFIKKEFEK